MAGYYEAKSMIFECGDCEWTGPGTDLEMLEAYEGLAEYGCPRCGTKVTNLVYPTWGEIQEAAQAGDPEAQEQLADIKKFDDWGAALRRRRRARCSHPKPWTRRRRCAPS